MQNPAINRAIENLVSEKLQIEAAIESLQKLNGRTKRPYRRRSSLTPDSKPNSDAASGRATRRGSKRSGKKRGAASRRQ